MNTMNNNYQQAPNSKPLNNVYSGSNNNQMPSMNGQQGNPNQSMQGGGNIPPMNGMPNSMNGMPNSMNGMPNSMNGGGNSTPQVNSKQVKDSLVEAFQAMLSSTYIPALIKYLNERPNRNNDVTADELSRVLDLPSPAQTKAVPMIGSAGGMNRSQNGSSHAEGGCKKWIASKTNPRYCNNAVYRTNDGSVSEYCAKCLGTKTVQDVLKKEGKQLPQGIQPYVPKNGKGKGGGNMITGGMNSTFNTNVPNFGNNANPMMPQLNGGGGAAPPGIPTFNGNAGGNIPTMNGNNSNTMSSNNQQPPTMPMFGQNQSQQGSNNKPTQPMFPNASSNTQSQQQPSNNKPTQPMFPNASSNTQSQQPTMPMFNQNQSQQPPTQSNNQHQQQPNNQQPPTMPMFGQNQSNSNSNQSQQQPTQSPQASNNSVKSHSSNNVPSPQPSASSDKKSLEPVTQYKGLEDRKDYHVDPNLNYLVNTNKDQPEVHGVVTKEGDNYTTRNLTQSEVDDAKKHNYAVVTQ
jgi:hypothetical protein